MIRHLLGLVVLVLGVIAPAHAQTVGEVCTSLTQEFRAAAVAVSQQASDVAGALAARAALAPKEAAAREKCGQGGFVYTVPIDVTKEDLDISLARKVPACNVFIEKASPFVASAQHARGDPEKAKVMRDTLLQLRGEAEAPCRDYPGVGGRMYRAELLLTSFIPPEASRPGKPE